MSGSDRPSEPPRRRRAWRWLLGALLALVALPLLALGGGLIWANSEGGRAALARLAAAQVPGLALEGLEGPLPGRLGIARLTLRDEAGVWLEVEGARLAWDPRALLRRELRVEALTARRVAVHRAPLGADPPAPSEPGPLLPDLPQLPVALRLDRLEVARIELGEALAGAAAVLRAEGRAALDAGGLTLAVDAATQDGGSVLGVEANLRPATGRLAARATLRGEAGGPVARLLGLAGRAPELDLVLDGPASGAALTLRAAAGEGLGLDLRGTLRAPDARRVGLTVDGRADASGLVAGPAGRLAGPFDLRLDADGRPDGTFDLRELRLAGAAGVVEASGRLDPGGGSTALRLRATLRPSAVFAGLLPGEALGWEAFEAAAEVTGALAAPAVALDLGVTGFRSAVAPLAALLGPAPRLRLRAVAPDRIEALTLTGQAIEAEAQGRVGATLDLTFRAAVAAVEGAALGLSGGLRLRGTAAGAAADPTVTLDAASDRLEVAGRVLEGLSLSARIAAPATAPAVEARAAGRFQDLPIGLDLRGGPDADGWLRLEAAEASFGPARLTAAGRLRPDPPLFDGTATLAVPDLAPFAPLAGQALGGRLRLEARLAPRDGAQGIEARLEAPELRAGGVTAERIAATVEGTPAGFDWTLAGRAQGVEAEARGRLAEAAGGRRLDLAALRATAQGETVRLSAPARITLAAGGGVEIGAATLALPRGGSLRAEGRWGPDRADIRAQLAPFNLAGIAALLPDIAPAGTVSGEARITGPVAAPEVAATLRGTGLRAGAPWGRGLPAGELRAEIRRSGDGAVAGNAEARLGAALRLNATARMPQGPGASQPLDGTLEGTIDLASLTSTLLAAGGDRVTGRLALNLRTSGPADAPVLGGEARLTGGSYRNPLLGVAVTELAGTLRPDGSRLRADIAGRTPGGGRLGLGGTIEPMTQYLPLDLVLTAQGAQPVASDILRATLDAELRLAGLLGTGATLSGPIRIRRAEIRVPDQLPASVRTLGEVTERGAPPGRAPRPTQLRQRPAGGGGSAPIALAIQVQAPRNVFVRGRGLDAELGGELAIGGRVDAPEINGELELRRGDLAVIGRRLAFDRGRLDFQGGLLPELDFRASSRAGAVTVRVEVTGSPTAPQITFSSTPELPQDEILARLLFDRPLRDLSPFEIAQVAQAVAGATGLPGGGATGLLDRVRQTIGLDRLAVGGGGEGANRRTSAEERSGATLEAGRYVADGVYLGVRQGTEPGSSRVGVRVDLTPRLRLEAETGDREAGERVGVSMEWEWGR
ncbi:translocation/assembly module TamB domain-containing protein [Falsiroseomonas sp. CW058]|uniref:translocation/assembly module TamB domain-containing protein n=1 Tax=Falsiroseomonas sp. CW058 TaxID=3388664 RepID=UPI003D315015